MKYIMKQFFSFFIVLDLKLRTEYLKVFMSKKIKYFSLIEALMSKQNFFNLHEIEYLIQSK